MQKSNQQAIRIPRTRRGLDPGSSEGDAANSGCGGWMVQADVM